MKHLEPKSILALVLVAALLCPAAAATGGQGQSPLEKAGAYVLRQVPSPQVGSTGGEWAVLGLARSALGVEQSWYNGYLGALEQTLRDKQGLLSSRKYTEYARVALAVTALGGQAESVAGYDLLAPLADYDRVVAQGVNGAIYALIALDNQPSTHWETERERYVQYICASQLPDGGWALSGDRADPDLTAQALQALAPHRKQQPQAVLQGEACLQELWQGGGFVTLEAYAQAILAHCALGKRPPKALVEEFLSFQGSDGSFAHVKGGAADQMATEQGLCALVALDRVQKGLPSFYDMGHGAPPWRELLLAAPAVAALAPACALGLFAPAG